MHFTVEDRLALLNRWFQRRNERPVLGFFLGPQYPLHRYHAGRNLPPGAVHPEDIVVKDYLADYERLFELNERLGGDLIWAGCPFWGIPWVEAALGCSVVADHETGSTRTEPPPGFAARPVVSEFSSANPWVAKMLEFMPAIVEHSRERYPVGTTLMRGVSDLLSALYGGESFIFRMLDAPDEVKTVVEKLADFWIAMGKCLLEHVPLFHGGTGSFFYGVWCPGKTLWLQEDAAALLSPDLYEEFVFPAVSRIGSAFEHNVIHLHPSMFMPIDYLLKTDIDVIELHIDKGGPTAEDLCPQHRQVLAEKPLIVWGDMTVEDLMFMLNNLPNQGLLLNMVVDSPEQARDVWRQASRVWN